MLRFDQALLSRDRRRTENGGHKHEDCLLGDPVMTIGTNLFSFAGRQPPHAASSGAALSEITLARC